MGLGEYVLNHTVRGDCQCGKCIDAAEDPKQPDTGHTADLIFFHVALRNDPSREDFIKEIREHDGEFCEVDVFDGNEHSYLEIGAWIGDQGLAMQFMGLGHLLGMWDLLTPNTIMPDFPDELKMRMAENGLVAIKLRTEA